MIAWIFVGTEGKAKGKKFYLYTSFSPDALWKLKQTLRALDVEIPDSAFNLDPDDVVDTECILVVVDNEYEGKTNSKLAEIRAMEESQPASPPPRRRWPRQTTARRRPCPSSKPARSRK